ncbi:MAG: hypothetical protein PHQ05_00620 [Sterolibacterium sp.]|nr:hypothetical protein [Sterolibacterium sp.]
MVPDSTLESLVGQAMPIDGFPVVIGHGDLEYIPDQINHNDGQKALAESRP